MHRTGNQIYSIQIPPIMIIDKKQAQMKSLRSSQLGINLILIVALDFI